MSLTHVQSPSPAEIRNAVALASASPLLRSARTRALLAFLVEETIAGRGGRLKAYSIATLLLERDANFDPQGDSIVRVEASKLRRALEIYYNSEGAGDEIAIVLPRGSYQPEFVSRASPEALQAQVLANRSAAAPPIAQPPTRQEGAPVMRSKRFARTLLAGVAAIAATGALFWWSHSRPDAGPVSVRGRLGPALTVRDFGATLGTEQERRLVSEFRVNLVHALGRFGRFRFHDGESPSEPADDAYEVFARRIEPGKLLVTARHRPTGETVWSSAISLGGDREEAVRAVATPLASPYGAIFSHERRMLETAPDSDGEACIIRTIDALRRGDPDQYPTCLKAIVVAHPHSMVAWSVLSRVYRGHYLNHGSPHNLALAREAAERGVELGPLNERARLADLEARFLSDPTAVDPAKIESIVSVNRFQADTLARAGRLAIAAGYFEQGEALIDEAGRFLPLAPIDWGMLFAADLSRGRHGRAASWSHQLGAGNNPLVKLLAIAAKVEANEAAAAEEVAAFAKRYPDIARAPDSYLQRWGFTQATRALLLNRLQAAGMPVL